MESTDSKIVEVEPREVVRSILGLKRMTVRDLANKMDVAEQSVSKMLSGSRKLTDQMLVKMSEALSVPFDLLRYKKGYDDYIEKTHDQLSEKRRNISYQYEHVFIQEEIILPYYPISVRTSLTKILNPDIESIETRYLKVFVYKEEDTFNDVIFEVNGDSMEPRLANGFRVRCKLIDSSEWAYISSGIYAIHYANSLVIKRVKDNEILSKSYLTVHSDNLETGGSTQIPVVQLRHIWKVFKIIDGSVY